MENLNLLSDDEEDQLPLGMTREQVEIMKEALQNPLVLFTIMRKISFHGLLSCRRVSLIWSSVASEVMLKRDCTKVCLCHHVREPQFSRRTVDGHPQPTLTDLTLSLDKSPNFPSTHYRFQNGNIMTEDTLQFFQHHGSNIKTLELAEHFEGRGQYFEDIFMKIIQPHAPNIEKLIIDDYELRWKDVENDQINLSSLKILEWIFQRKRVSPKPIVRGAENVKSLDFSALDNVRTVIDWNIHVAQVGKGHLIKQLRLSNSVFVPEGEIKLIHLANFQPQLQNLTFDELREEDLPEVSDIMKSALQKIIDSSQSTLEVLCLDEICQLVPQLILPPLPKLMTLGLGGQTNPIGRCLPPGIDLLKTFPNLTKLDCSELACHNEEEWAQFFPANDPYQGSLPKVEVLIMNQWYPESCIVKLQALCPNVRDLFIFECDQQLVEFMPIVVRLWPHLRSINVDIPGSLEPALGLLHWDVMVTGFSPETCERLLQNHDEVKGRENNFEGLKIQPSIRDLKGLKKLEINHREFGIEDDLVRLSNVTSLYGFQLMPKLRVGLTFEHRLLECHPKGLKSVYEKTPPYVNLRDDDGY